ncbi:DNA repair exonuclease [Clostridium sp. C8-1-8]|uniref:metallophosphoesterase family protein n=1 Tax=Clostridium sp. C8-1-8 TaxID=2698831 RepID=UPI00137067E4|nr:DNA repair exonuclease [Clostridium sp. C8-1-8]
MNKIKILHCSDLHFDTPFSDLPIDVSEQRKEELQETFSSVIELANKEGVDAVLLAGDIFDNLRVRKSTLDFLRRRFESIPNVDIFISPGNHDPVNSRSFYKMIEWPSNVHIFDSGFSSYVIKDKNVVVYGAGFTTNYIKKSMLMDFKILEEHKNFIKLMVLHGEVAASNSLNEYNPITVEDIGNSSMNYIALGHKHQFSEIKRSRDTLYAYCGCPEGRGFDELGQKGIIIGEIGEGYSDLRFVPMNKRSYNIQNINVANITNYEDIKIRVLEAINKESREKDLYKIVLTGEIEEEFNLDIEILTNKLSEYFYFVKVEDSTKIKLNVNEVTVENSIKGIFAKKLIEKLGSCEEEEKDIYELALKFGIQSLSEGEIVIDDN